MPHHPARHPDDEQARVTHTYRQHLGMVMAERQAKAFAGQLKDKRLRTAHEYLLAGHVIALMDGLGDAEAFAWVDRLMADLGDSRGG